MEWNYSGMNPESSALANIINSKSSSSIATESDVFGFGGGIAFGYFLFQYKGYPPNLYIGTRNFWHDTNQFLQNAARIYGCMIRHHTASSLSAAQKKLDNALADGPVIACLDARIFESKEFDTSEPGATIYAAILGRENGSYVLDNCSGGPVSLSEADFKRARQTQKRAKFEFFTVEKEQAPLDKKAAFTHSLKAQAETPLHPGIPASGAQSSLGLPGMQKWIKALRADKGKTSWLSIVNSTSDLSSLLQQVRYWITQFGTDGSANRILFSRFCRDNQPENMLNEALTEIEKSIESWAAIDRIAEEGIAELKRQGSDQELLQQTQSALQTEMAEELEKIYMRESKFWQLVNEKTS
jgi:hypothetical protein